MRQSQASLNDQLRALIPVANFHGYYDAADFIQRHLDSVMRKLDEFSPYQHSCPPFGSPLHGNDPNCKACRTEPNKVIRERPPMGGRRVDFVPDTQPPLYIKDPSGAKVMVPNPDHPSRKTGPLYPHCHD